MLGRDALRPRKGIFESRGVVDIDAALRVRRKIDWKFKFVGNSIAIEIVGLGGDDRGGAAGLAAFDEDRQSEAAGKIRGDGLGFYDR